ncbi:MAG: hypothetical protein OHK0031_07810 [Anaerolineales bacterium]
MKFQPMAALLAAIFLISACVAPPSAPPPTVPPPTVTPAPSAAPRLWIAPSAPEKLREAESLAGLERASSAAEASLRLEPVSGLPGALWIYAFVAAFPTVEDGATLEQVKSVFHGASPRLLLTASTLEAMKTLLGGEPGPGVEIVSADGLSEALWQDSAARAIVPFEQISPKMKVLTLDGQSPLWKSFDPQPYPLKLVFAAGSLPLPSTNRDPAKLTTLLMTGVTALVRATAAKMESNGLTYPGEGLRDWLRQADIAHISNEVAFAENCPPPDPYQTALIFCSDPKYMALLEDVGVDVLELTGNHFEDWGREATLHTLEMYRARNLPYFGGGSDLADSQKAALLERNGMKFAFIGCNPAGPEFAWARADGWPGAAPCGDYGWMVAEIQRLKSEGYLVIATLQYFEYYTPEPRPWQLTDFRRLAEAGATIVSGSQGHYAQALEFYGASFVHYGLGNLFFDQMGYTYPSNGQRTTNTRREFLDRHVFYDGQYIGTELLTAMLEDYARPRPMTSDERAAFLEEYFAASGWR